MSVLTTTTKGLLGVKAGKTAAKHPGAVKNVVKTIAPAGKATFQLGKPLLDRRLRRKATRLGRTTGMVLTDYGPQAAYALGLAEPPRRRRTAPWLGTGVIIGAGSAYLLDPDQGAKRRKKIAQLVS